MRIAAALVLTILLTAKAAHADAVVAHGAGLYAVPSKSAWFKDAVTPELVNGLQFVTFNVAWVDGAATVSLGSETKVGEVTFLDKPVKEKPPFAEGCAESPMEWWRNGKKVARLTKKLRDEAFMFGLPADFQEKKLSADDAAKTGARIKAALEKPQLMDGEKCAKQGRFYAKGDDVLAFCETNNGLNTVIAVLSQKGQSTWRLEHTFTVSDDCP